MNWNVADAKNRLSEVLTRADEEAQTIVRRDREYVVLSGKAYRKLRGQDRSLADYLIDGGPRSDELAAMKRPATPMREPGL